MGIKTSISYCDSTVNPAPFCAGCELHDENPRQNHCYAKVIATRWAGRPGWPKTFQTPTYFLMRLVEAIHWSDLTGKARPHKPWLNGQPRIIFINDIGDGFSPLADPFHWLAPFIADMRRSPHVYLLLTKWPHKMAHFWQECSDPVPDNFVLGTSVTSEKYLWRIEELQKIPARRWISFEPLLGPVALALDKDLALGGMNVDWVVAGGESGQNARPCHPDWARLLRNDCQESNTPFFWKQWGAWLPFAQKHPFWSVEARDYFQDLAHGGAQIAQLPGLPTLDFYRVGKNESGDLLDGCQHHETPNFCEWRIA